MSEGDQGLSEMVLVVEVVADHGDVEAFKDAGEFRSLALAAGNLVGSQSGQLGEPAQLQQFVDVRTKRKSYVLFITY